MTESCDVPANGVKTIPIADSAKPTTTFDSDPLAQSIILDLDDIQTTASIVPEPSMGSDLVLGPEETEAASSESSDYAKSVDLGGIQQDVTTDASSSSETKAAGNGGLQFGLPIDIESLTLSSILDLGNLGEGNNLKARATNAP